MSIKRILQLLYDIGKEYYLFIAYPIFVFFHKSTIYRNPHPLGTIVFVSCWFNRNHYHDFWISYLEKRGFRTYYIFLPFLFENFQQTVIRLDHRLSALKLKHYTIVGISTGSLVCLYYLALYKKWKEVYIFISIGGPLHGTIAALGLVFASKGRALMPWSSFIEKLQQIPIPPGKMITVSASFDELASRKSTKMRGNTAYM